MRINNKILSLPPYISTSWKNIATLHIEEYDAGASLLIELCNGTIIEVPKLDPAIIDTIFAAHAKFLDQEPPTSQSMSTPSKASITPMNNAAAEQVVGFSFPLQLSNAGLDHLGAVLQHNPEQADAPDLPEEILNKISAISKAVGIDDAAVLPKAEPHCNCMHCQIARAVNNESNVNDIPITEEEVTAEDLTFRGWDINQTGEKLYLVTNPLDNKEHYNVYLGEPIGCTCGEKNCEHIRAVLNS